MRLKNSISEEATFDYNIDWFFEFTQDFTERLRWDQQMKNIAFMEGHSQLERGAKVLTETSDGITMQTEYLSFDPPKEISIKMLNKAKPFRVFIGSWNYIPVGETQTTLRITYRFDLQFPYNLIPKTIKGIMRKNLQLKFISLENHLKNAK